MTGVFIRDRRRSFHAEGHKGKKPCRHRGRGWDNAFVTKGRQQHLELENEKKGSALGPSEGAWPHQLPELRLRPPEL